MSPPRPDWTVRSRANFKSQGARPSARGAALADWIRLADLLVAHGAEIAIVPPPESAELTGLPYTAEAGQIVPGSRPREFLLPTLTPAHRRREPAIVARAIEAWGWRTSRCPVRWEGQGDVLWLDDRRAIHTYGVGPQARSQAEAFAWVARALGGEALQLGFRAEPWFHGNTWLAVFHDAEGAPAVLYCPEALLPGEEEKLRAFTKGLRLERLSRDGSLAYATNALQVDRTVLAPPGVPTEVTTFWKEIGCEVVRVALPELFGRGGGAAVCLTNRLNRVTANELPPDALYPAFRPRLVGALETA